MSTHIAQSGGPLAATIDEFFETKTAADVEGTMSYFSPDLATYIDATLGWELASYEALKELRPPEATGVGSGTRIRVDAY